MELFEPLCETPSQYADSRRPRRPFEGERRLWLAVAEMALKDWRWATQDAATQPPAFAGWKAPNREAKRLRVRQELSEWLIRDDSRPGSLRMLCEAFDMDCGSVRKRLLAGDVVELPRAEPRGAPVIVRGRYRVRA